MNRYIAILFLFISFNSFCQGTQAQLPKGIPVTAVIENGDTIPVINLPQVWVVSERTFKSSAEATKYYKLRRDVKRVYPYAILAAAKLKEYNVKLESIPNEKQRKIYMKKAEKELKNQFEGDLKKLTISQGRILIKLIDRETGATSYDLVRELRGSFSAFMWQSLARLFGTNLKSEYDGKGDDRAIEEIIQLIEAGRI
jgi:hypothetical protein